MKPMEEADRYNYPELVPDSIVIEGGAYECNWANELWKKYRCKIISFEPIKSFWHNCMNRRMCKVDIQVINRALGAYPRFETFNVQNDSSGMFAGSGVEELVEVVAIGPIVDSWPQVDLLKLNVEGMEYEILEALISQDLMRKVVNLQVQFHRIGGANHLRSTIQQGLSKTHDLVYNEPWCWEGWKLRK